MPVISVIVPVYNSELFIDRCLESIIKQTFSDFELILVDDGSTDSSLSICEAYVVKDKRIKLFSQKNAGQSVARNKGVQESVGEWICFVDSDDCINPFYLEYLYKTAMLYNAKMAVCQYLEAEEVSKNFFDQGKYSARSFIVSNENILSIAHDFPNAYCTVWAKIVKREIVLQNMFEEGRIYEDNAIAPRWLFEAKEVAVIDLPLYFYTVNYSSTTNKIFSIKQLDLLWAYEEQLKVLEEYGYNNMIAEILMSYMNIVDSLSAQLLTIGEKRRRIEIRSHGRKVVRKYKSFIMNRNIKKRYILFVYPSFSRALAFVRALFSIHNNQG